ncbi:MAG: YHS domain-containing protein [Ignavibacteriaceae bacterium]|nr:YHS domain-containing protein [Ignavibacteriaceae bacterium]
MCPVTDEEADGEIVAVHKGVTYALCCKRCLKKFEKDPEKYIKKLNQTK